LSLLALPNQASEIEKFILQDLTKLDIRIFAVEVVYRSGGNLLSGSDQQVLRKNDLVGYLCKLNFSSLNKYKIIPLRVLSLGKHIKGFNECISVPTIYDRIVQQLFFQVLDPVVDVKLNSRCFGFRKGRNLHQALGSLAFSLHAKKKSKRKQQTQNVKRNFVISK